MKVRVLGCSGAIAKECRTTSFLLDADILVDAGTGVGDLTLDEMLAIDHSDEEDDEWDESDPLGIYEDNDDDWDDPVNWTDEDWAEQEQSEPFPDSTSL